MIKLLAIGNSFSQDATHYLHDMALCNGINTKIVNLCIGGCSLETHADNFKNDNCAYEHQLNGEKTDQPISIAQALQSDQWDIITLQQASKDSGIIESYLPHGQILVEHIRKQCPDSRLMVHQTWAYETDCQLEFFARYNNNQATMYNAIKKAYAQFATRFGLDIIPSGDIIQVLRAQPPFDYPNGGQSLCCDGFHMHLIYGRFAVSAVWLEKVLGGDILKNNYIPPTATEEHMPLLDVIRRTVNKSA